MDHTLYNLLLQETRFLLGAETEQASRVRELAETVHDANLRRIFESHAEETDRQVLRLERVLSEAGEEGEGEVPAGVDGMIEDAEMIVDMDLGEASHDIAIAAAARKMEHYEIACYESMITIAQQLGLEEVLQPLRESLEEEKRADRELAEACLPLIRSQVAIETEPAG